jgi:hypothetical protein
MNINKEPVNSSAAAALSVDLTDIMRLASNVADARVREQEKTRQVGSPEVKWRNRQDPPDPFDWALKRLRITYEASAYARTTFFLHALAWHHLMHKGLVCAHELATNWFVASPAGAGHQFDFVAVDQLPNMLSDAPDGGATLANCGLFTVRSAKCDAHLITINQLCDLYLHNETDLVACAKDVLRCKDIDGTINNIVMLDSAELLSRKHRSYQVYDRNVHLVGNPDEVRFVIFVSELTETKEPTKPPEEAPYEGRFRISKSLLRDAFVGRHDKAADHPVKESVTTFLQELAAHNAIEHAGKTSWAWAYRPNFQLQNRRGTRAFFPQFGASASGKSSLINPLVDVSGGADETLISKSRIARTFFGFKGLPDFEPK